MSALPPLNPLRAFEAAGRLKSIRRAAEELAVTPGAVSRQVQILETHLGVRLFRRLPRAITLTAAGEQYLEQVSFHLAGIETATAKLTGKTGRQQVKIRAYTTFAMKWLIPRLTAFHAQHQSVEVRLTTSLEEVDFDREDVDGAVRLGGGDWKGHGVDLLVRNELVPVCAPRFSQERRLRAPGDLASHMLLHSLARPDDWAHWLRHAGLSGIDAYGGQKYESSVLAYQAAIEGQGVAMAQRALVQGELAAGTLVAPFPLQLDMGRWTYYLIYPQSRLRNPAFRVFRDWLLANASAGASGGAG